MVKKFFKDILGITAKEQAIQEELLRAEKKRIAAEKREAKRKENKAKLEEFKSNPKDIATNRGEPWVDVISFNVNKDDIKNGFYELDWNEYFILELKRAGYGYDGDPDEEIVNRWFRDICINVASEVNIDMENRSTGYIDITKLANNKAEVK